MIYQNYYRDLVPVAPVVQPPQQYVAGGKEDFQLGAGNKVIAMNADGLWIGAARFVDAPFRVGIDGLFDTQGINIPNWISVTLLNGWAYTP